MSTESAPADGPAVELSGVRKTFGEVVALEGLTLRLEGGSFLGLLGRNGAGKSTTIKLLTGLLRPTTGTVRVLGRSVEGDAVEVKRQLGVIPEDLALLDRLTGPQYLRFVGRMYGLSDAVADARREELFELLDLSPGGRTVLADYSYGMKKKAALAAALVHGPKLLLLDEPFEGIDPVTSRTIKDLLLRLSGRGVTIVLTSHILEIVERLCPLIAIIEKGRLEAFGTLDELRGPSGGSLESLFVERLGGARSGELSWL